MIRRADARLGCTARRVVLQIGLYCKLGCTANWVVLQIGLYYKKKCNVNVSIGNNRDSIRIGQPLKIDKCGRECTRPNSLLGYLIWV